ncbi:MAG: MFS transporter [Streptosporangiaceae bacterium]
MRAVAVKRFRERHSDRFSVLRERNFRRFCIGYSTSLFGTAMSSVAIAFAVLGSGGTATELGLVFAAGIVPQVALMPGGGLAADRLGSRRVMLAADAARCCAQAGLAAAVLLGRPPVWVFVALAFVVGTGDAVFPSALAALTVRIAPRAELGSANAVLGLAQSAARVAGPALAGVLVAVAGAGTVIALDAASYAISGLALSLLGLAAVRRPAGRPLLRDLAEGWAEFRSRTCTLGYPVPCLLLALHTPVLAVAAGTVVAGT